MVHPNARFGGRGNPMPPEVRARIVARRARGATLDEIAREVGVATRTVSRVIADAGGMASAAPRWKDRCPSRLSPAEREEIRSGLDKGDSLRLIAARLGRAPSTISREVAANGGRDGYQAWRADQRAWEQARRPKRRKLDCNDRLGRWVAEQLEQRWSPAQISARLNVEFADDEEMRVSPETIYQTLYLQGRGELRKELAACLRSGRARRRPHGRTPDRERIRDMVMISERPAEIEDRAVPGHWEGDLIIGKDGRTAIVTLVERATRFVMLGALPEGRTAE